MTDPEYKLIPLQKTQSIPIHWEFSQNDYDKLAKGHRSNWCVFLRDDVVHVCRIGGEEFYRFAVSRVSDGTYAADSLETYVTDGFHVDLRKLAVEETAGLLASYFGIDVTRVSKN